MAQSTVQLLVGPIASGKSTYARNAAAKGMVIINDDALVEALHGGNYGLYDKNLKPLYKQTENTILTTAVALGKSVVVDRGTNNSIESRRRWIGLANSLDCPVVAIVFPDEGAAVQAERRAAADGRGHGFDYWYRVAKNHIFYGSDPVTDEGFDEVLKADWTDIQRGWIYE